MTWTPSTIAMLRTLYGTMPARELAKLLGVSRFAVIGKAYRLGLAKSKSPKEAPMAVEHKEPIHGRCHYIAADTRDPSWRYCHKVVRKPLDTYDGPRSVEYCAKHYSLMYVAPRPVARREPIELFRRQGRAA